MAANDDILHQQVSHAIGLQRLSTQVVGRIVALLNSVDADLLEQIKRRDPFALEGAAGTKRLVALLDVVKELNVSVYRRVQADLTTEMQNLAVYEAQYQVDLLNNVLPVRLDWAMPSPQMLRSIVTARPFQGYLLREWVAGLEDGRRQRLRQALRISLTEGETVDQAVRRVRGTAALNYQDGILQVSRRSAEGIVRTAINHVTTAAREVLYEENASLIKGVRWVSTLDLRTSPICRARDGKVFPVGKGPRPPAHIRCRSTTSPVVKSWKELGINLQEAPAGTRSSMNGQVPADLTYSEWLRKQPAAAQDDVLGKSAGRLYRKGELPLDKFVDRTGASYTLDELRKREAAAWERSGLGA